MPWRIPAKGDPLVWEVLVMVPVLPRQLLRQFLLWILSVSVQGKRENRGNIDLWINVMLIQMQIRPVVLQNIKNLMVPNIYHARGKMVKVDFPLANKETIACTRKWNRLPNMIPSPQFVGIP